MKKTAIFLASRRIMAVGWNNYRNHKNVDDADVRRKASIVIAMRVPSLEMC